MKEVGRKAPWAAVAVTVLSLSMAWVPAAPATAATCTTSSHCYGVTEWVPNPIHGIAESLDANCLYTSSASSNFVTQEMWLATNSSPGTYWVEEGMAYGAPQGGLRYWFWADNRPNGGGYHEHDLTIAANLNTRYAAKITYAGSSTFNVYRDAVLLGSSTGQPGTSVWESAGEETTNASAQSAAMHNTIQYLSATNVWATGWGGASLIQDQPPFATWANAYYNLGAYSNCSFAASPSDVPTTDTTGGPASVLKRLAFTLAGQNGDSSPTAIQYVSTQRQAATAASGEGASRFGSNGRVFLVAARGHFTGYAAKRPKGQSPPHGTYLAFTVNPITNRIDDWSITDIAPGLSRLGNVHRLL